MQKTQFFIIIKNVGFRTKKKEQLREALLFCFNLKICAAESHRLLVAAYGEHALSQTICRDWFRRFKNNDFDVNDKKRPDQLKKFEDGELESLFQENSCQMSKSVGNIKCRWINR